VAIIPQEVVVKKRRRRIFGGLVAVVVLGAAAALVVMFTSLPNGVTGQAVRWRAKLFAEKAEWRVPELSWRELWFMTHAHGGFGMENFVNLGFSLQGAVLNPFVSDSDHANGQRIFEAHCAVCHGKNGTGAYGPALNHTGFSRGDSDLAVYEVVRDGIPKTAMPRVPMSIQERWQVVGYLRSLQQHNSGAQADELPPLHIQVSSEEIRNAGTGTDQWLTYSGSLSGSRYTPLNQITPENVSQLKVRWVHQFHTDEADRSESTPIVVGGTIFTVEPPANVTALDAATGAVRWRYIRDLPDKLPLCCYRTNRGLAILGNTLYFGALDCYLVALDANTGNVIWQSQVCKTSDGYSMTGAPLIVNESVVVGVAGGEYGIRGYLASYDAKTGQQQWKFNTIPGPGELGHDTWKNDAWKTGGGPTWVTGSYDPSLGLIYWGVGNPAPGLQGDVRWGDNLFANSLIALHADSGKLAWYFQFTPHDEHDWDAAQTPILTDLPIKGAMRKVLCVADRNGFYYVLDRTNGQFLVGVPFVTENWAEGLDSTGRPILTSHAEGSPSGRVTRPGVGGGINWQNSALDPKTETFFVPATEGASVFVKSPNPQRGYLGYYVGSWGGNYVEPEQRVVRALDAATGTKKWELWDKSQPLQKESPAYGHSGLLVTGGGLVFGESGGYAFAIDSAKGRELWRVFLGGETWAPPISVTVDGHQVVLITGGQSLYMFGL
jgi:alcohol dehydrogenase (cytochrome c)